MKSLIQNLKEKIEMNLMDLLGKDRTQDELDLIRAIDLEELERDNQLDR